MIKKSWIRYLALLTISLQEANDVLNAILGLGQLLVFGHNSEERYLFI